LIVEIDLDLDDVRVTLTFARKDAPIEYRGAYRDTERNGRTHRVRYEHELPESVLSLAKDRAIEACAAYDDEPTTERKVTS
jgi:hypothetical protein